VIALGPRHLINYIPLILFESTLELPGVLERLLSFVLLGFVFRLMLWSGTAFGLEPVFLSTGVKTITLFFVEL
jgi:hypothetical protein